MENNTFSLLLREHKDRIYRMCLAYAGNQEDAKDMFQEVLVNIWKSMPSFRGQSSLLTWVYRITVNVCLRARYNEDRRQARLYSSIELESVQVNVIPPERYEALYACIHKLGETDKSLIMMYLDELTYKEISAVTGLTENNIAVKISRIKDKLFQCLQP